MSGPKIALGMSVLGGSAAGSLAFVVRWYENVGHYRKDILERED